MWPIVQTNLHGSSVPAVQARDKGVILKIIIIS